MTFKIEYVDESKIKKVQIADIEHRRYLNQDGYGNKIPTRYLIQYGSNRWRRVYCILSGNSGSYYITVKGEDIFIPTYVDLDGLSIKAK